MNQKHVKVSLILIISIIIWHSCDEGLNAHIYPENIGDIPFNPDIDDPSFKVCKEAHIVQHYRPYLSSISSLYEGDKFALVEYLKGGYANKQVAGQSGFITTRFVVSCTGQKGRYRTETMDNNYQYFDFEESIAKSILTLIKEDANWLPMTIDGNTYDYYVYVSVELEDGIIKKVLP